MKELRKEELNSLKNVLEDLQKFIRNKEKKKLPYYYVQFDNMINNIEICLQSEELDTSLISHILFRDWTNANHELIGVSACELLCSDYPEHIEDAYHFIELITVVGSYFTEEDVEEYELNETFWGNGLSNK